MKRAKSGGCQHEVVPIVPYIIWYEDAKKRREAGEKQRFCLECGRWVWESHWKNEVDKQGAVE